MQRSRLRIAMLLAVFLLSGCGARALDSHEPGLDVGRAALNSGDADVAMRVAAERLQKSPRNVEALLLQGDALSAEGRSQEAEAAFRQVLALQPASIDARLGLGRLVLTRDPQSAEVLFLEVVARDPRNSVALNDLGISRDLQGHHAQAQEAYRLALGSNPDMQAAVVNLALSLALSGQPKQARDLLRPIGTAEDAAPRVKDDFALVSEMAGDHTAVAAPVGSGVELQDQKTSLDGYESGVQSKDSARKQ